MRDSLVILIPCMIFPSQFISVIQDVYVNSFFPLTAGHFFACGIIFFKLGFKSSKSWANEHMIPFLGSI